MAFLPDNYKQPEQKSNYLKFKEGETEFRILSDSITGYVYFNLENKPVRTKEFPEDYKAHAKINEKTQKQDYPKHFRAFVVWNYTSKNIAILEVTQKTIQDAILAYNNNAKRGDPKDYDLTVTRDDSWAITSYTVIPNPKTDVDKNILSEYFDAQVNLEKLFSNEDLFTK